MNSFENFETFKQSYKFNKQKYDLGILAEKEVLPVLRKFFKDDSLKPLSDGSHFDFKGQNKIIELKSRTCNRHTYRDTAIGVQKISYAKQSSVDVYFIFQFIDGLYYWKYNPTDYLRLGAISTSGIAHLFIPVVLLTQLKV